MSKVLDFDFRTGSMLNKVTKVAGSIGSGFFERNAKGLAYVGTGASWVDLNETINLGTVHTVEWWAYFDPWTTTYNVCAGSAGSSYALALRPNNTTLFYHDGVSAANESRTSELNKLHAEVIHLMVIRNDTSVTFYINGIAGASQVLATNNDQTISRLFQRAGTLYHYGSTNRIRIYDHILSNKEIARNLKEFTDSLPILETNYPEYDILMQKPLALDWKHGLVAAYNMIADNETLVDVSHNGGNGTLSGFPTQTAYGLYFDGEVDKVQLFIPLALAQAVKTVAFRIKLTSNTEKILEGLANDHFIFANAGTLNYPDYDNAFIDGEDSDNVYAGLWHTIIVTSSTAVSNATATLALNNVTYGSFEIADLKFYSKEFTLADAKAHHNQFIKPVLVETFKDEGVGMAIPTHWTPGTGSFEIGELTSQDAVLKHLDVGTKYLECTSNGTIAIPSKSAYGTWEFDLWKNTTANQMAVRFMANSDYTGLYAVVLTSSERVALYKAAVLGQSAASYITNTTWYRIKIIRSKSGEFTIYIKGGAFGNQYTLVDVTGGSGSNPVTDNTYTTSEYFVLDFDSGDRISNIIIQNGIKQ